MNRFCIECNLQVAQNGWFIIKPVYLRGSMMMSTWEEILVFGSLKAQQMNSSRTFCSPKLSLQSWINHYIHKKFPEYPHGITVRILVIVIQFHSTFHGLKITNCIDSQTSSGTSFACAKKMCAFVDTDLLLNMKMVAEIYIDVTFEPASLQNGRFQEEMGKQKLSFQNRSLPFKMGHL